MFAGFDFGTTNSSIALAGADGVVRLAEFPTATGVTESFRSLLYLERVREGHRTTIKSWSGPDGIDRYLHADDAGRLVQSLKSFLASRTLQSTEVFGKRFRLEDLVAKMLREIRVRAGAALGTEVRNVVVGRPVRFVGSDSTEDDDYALRRLRTALEIAGFEEVRFEYEPVGAAYHYESTLDHDELILIGDFGGGTSDFSLLRVGPGMRTRATEERVLGNEGVPIAGDSFDARIIRHLVSPALGDGTLMNSNGKVLPVPSWVYRKLERWHYLSFLKSRETINMLASVAVQANEPQKVNALLYLIRHDLGYQLHRAVQRLKIDLSSRTTGIFRFDDGDVKLENEATRDAFDSWIAPELQHIERGLASLLDKTGVAPKDVDAVFLTGGSSLVPAVRRIFEASFGTGKLRSGDEFTSVARGLALSASG